MVSIWDEMMEREKPMRGGNDNGVGNDENEMRYETINETHE